MTEHTFKIGELVRINTKKYPETNLNLYPPFLIEKIISEKLTGLSYCVGTINSCTYHLYTDDLEHITALPLEELV